MFLAVPLIAKRAILKLLSRVRSLSVLFFLLLLFPLLFLSFALSPVGVLKCRGCEKR